jgi:NitT/TauT family transport system permease protein
LKSIFVNKWAVRAYALVIFLVAWQVVGQSLNPVIWSPPGKVATRLLQLLADGSINGIPVNTLITVETVLAGYIPAIVVGIPLGMLMGRNRTAEYSLDPSVNLVYAVPLIVMIPILLIWFGSTITPEYLLVFIAAVLPIIINSMAGAKNVRADLLETGKSFGFGGAGMLRKITFPASLPYVMAGLRIGVGHAVIGAILAELFMYPIGLGNLIESAATNFDAPGTIAAVIVTILLGILLTELVKVFERKVSTWSVEFGTE